MWGERGDGNGVYCVHVYVWRVLFCYSSPTSVLRSSSSSFLSSPTPFLSMQSLRRCSARPYLATQMLTNAHHSPMPPSSDRYVYGVWVCGYVYTGVGGDGCSPHSPVPTSSVKHVQVCLCVCLCTYMYLLPGMEATSILYSTWHFGILIGPDHSPHWL